MRGPVMRANSAQPRWPLKIDPEMLLCRAPKSDRSSDGVSFRDVPLQPLKSKIVAVRAQFAAMNSTGYEAGE